MNQLMEPIVRINCSDDGEDDLVIAEPPELDSIITTVSSPALECSKTNPAPENHANERQFRCEHCNHRCSSLTQLKIHMNEHSVSKPFWCLLCEYRCRNKANLKSHLRSHSNERPHACHFCPYKSKTRVNLKNHLRKHTGEKPYSCTVCTYKCSTQGGMNVHVRVHTGEKPYLCTQCNYKSATSGALKSHYQVHSGETPYKCSECPKSFSKLGLLKRHKNSHTADRTYRCPKCSFQSDVPEDISAHISQHDNDRSSGLNHVMNPCQREEETNYSGELSRQVFDAGAPTTSSKNFLDSVRYHQGFASSTYPPADPSHTLYIEDKDNVRSSLDDPSGFATLHAGLTLGNHRVLRSSGATTSLRHKPGSITLGTEIGLVDHRGSLSMHIKSSHGCHLESPSTLRRGPAFGDQSELATLHAGLTLGKHPVIRSSVAASSLSHQSGSLTLPAEPFIAQSGFPILHGGSTLGNDLKCSSLHTRSPPRHNPLYTNPSRVRSSFGDQPVSLTLPTGPKHGHHGSHCTQPSSSTSLLSPPFACIFCDRLFSDMSVLKVHLAAHSDDPKLGMTWPKFSVPFSFLDGVFPPNHLQDIHWNETGMPSRFNGFFSMFFGDFL